MQYTTTIQNLIDAFSSLPGIGARSAERIAFHLLKLPSEEALSLARAIHDLKTRITHCSVCYNLAELSSDGPALCEVCRDARRDRSTICVVEQPKDLLAIDASGTYHGLYHVLLGRVAPLDGTDESDLTIAGLLERLKGGEVREVIFGTNPNLDGDLTLLSMQKTIGERFPGIQLTRLARGLAAGTQIEYANRSVLDDAIRGRQSLSSEGRS